MIKVDVDVNFMVLDPYFSRQFSRIDREGNFLLLPGSDQVFAPGSASHGPFPYLLVRL